VLFNVSPKLFVEFAVELVAVHGQEGTEIGEEVHDSVIPWGRMHGTVLWYGATARQGSWKGRVASSITLFIAEGFHRIDGGGSTGGQ
jgi:hypothetical protein